ncbi:murein hydrolase activator EnvC family protein [Sphingosinithalassobacter sp. LHW66-3]|uniref:murein hydrolase activator EnvC family protein n=1 Tax=Sphingosinithalassobacter sp. LHW66-3 TaxID=3424718 RepID=UPI003D6B7741
MGPVRSSFLAAALLAMLAGGTLVRAQTPSIDQQQDRLRAARDASRAAQQRSQDLERAAAAARDDAAQARAREAAAAARIQAAEADILAARARIAIVDRLLDSQRTRLAERQGAILRLVAALQSLARRPPALGLVQPGSTEDIVHVRAVLGTTLPVVEARTADVRAELERIRSLRSNAEAAVRTLRESRERLEAERLGLVRMEAQHRLRSRQLDRTALIESDRAIALGERARDIVDQMEEMETAGEVRSDLETLPGPLPRPRSGESEGEGQAFAGGSGRAAPYRLPVAGQVVRGLGEVSATGVRARGLTIASWKGAEVVAPAAGRVVYADPFRGYRGVIIIDHGQGWTSLLTGVAEIGVEAGDTIAQGARVARAADAESPTVTVELRRRGQPMDITALLD